MDAEEKVKEIIADQLGVKEENLKLESRFIEDLDADEFDVLELVMRLEDEWGIVVPNDDEAEFVTVGGAIDYIKKAIGTK